jgi:DNA-binding FadR family transcriptional regulator|tara:strand:+ start:803 stop:1597 length:795 start_codon:yes stop_codon:yes gene_type:complete
MQASEGFFMNTQVNSSTGTRLYRQVVTKILTLTDSGEYPAGSRLPSERELAERFSVSRPTIREAVIALEAQGVVTVKTGSGVYVRERQPELLNLGQAVSPFELIEARVYLEGEAAAIAASLITDAQLSLLKELLKEMADENIQDNIASAGADRKFHSLICEASNNKILGLFISQLWEAQENVENIKRAHTAVCMKDIEQRMAEHEAIYEALKSRDANSARAAMRSHFARMMTALHQTTEEAAVNEAKLNALKIRERFSFKRMVD